MSTGLVSELPRPHRPSAEDPLLATFERMRARTRGRPPSSARERIDALQRLEETVLRHREDIASAVCQDFGNRSRHESLIAEVFATLQAVRYARAHVESWMSPRRREVGWTFLPGRARVLHQPLGLIGIISPWNYPVHLALAPLVGALAAGNAAMIKPSESVPATAALLEAMVREAFGPDEVAVVTGGPEVGEAFARLPFDHLVFTGSTRVGRLVMRAAAENLTPVTLELGGKSPVIVGPDAKLEHAAKRILAGKLFNAGQTCIAPDYVLLPEGRQEELLAACRRVVTETYPTLAANPDYTAVIDDRHYRRLIGYLEEARARGARVQELNPASELLPAATRKVAPTLVLDPPEELQLMQEEIFGPILPVRTVRDLGDAIAYVNARPRPLALYYFGRDKRDIERVLEETVSGGVTLNDTLLHFAQDDLPFGGVGASGMGHYHAYEGFEAFSKKKPIFEQSRINAVSLLSPPYGKKVEALLALLIGR